MGVLPTEEICKEEGSPRGKGETLQKLVLSSPVDVLGYMSLPGVTLTSLLQKGKAWPIDVAGLAVGSCYLLRLRSASWPGAAGGGGEMRGAWGPAEPGDWRECSRQGTGKGGLGWRLSFTFPQVRTGRLRPKVNALGI